MASGYPGPVSATQVGSFFVGQYYQILRKQPDLAHQFYADSSTMIRIDGDSSENATGLLQIHTLITSLSFSGIEIKTINSLESWNGGILVVVSGCVKVVDVGGKRKFVETFLLAPQDKGYFVLNDICHFIEDDVIHHSTVPVLSENRIDSQLPAPTSHREVPGYPTNHYDFEAEASEYVDSVHIEGGNDQIDEYRIEEHEEQLQQQPQVPETHKVLEDIPAEEPSHFRENFVEPVPQPPPRSVEEPVGEPQKLTYASILRAPKGQSAPSVISRPSVTNATARPSEWQQPQPSLQQPIVAEQPNMDSTEDNPSVEEVEMLKSVYVRNLPSNISAAEIEQEFKNFGRIIPDGVFIRNRKDIGVCYAFVEFEDLQAVQNAIKASPIQLAGRLVYAEERRANSSGAASRGGRAGRGRGRGSYQSDSYRGQYGGRSSGRGFYQDGGDYNRYRGNGFRG